MKRQLKKYNEIKEILEDLNVKNIFLVTNSHFLNSDLIKYILDLNYNVIIFDKFSPNPLYEEVLEGVKLFNTSNCNFIISVGGGSSIDVAKCIKAFATMDSGKIYLNEKIIDSNIKHLAVPTTGGTGSEETHFAVVYYENKKYSVASECILPDYIYLDENFLISLPMYQKKSTMLDALCQAIESMWSVNATCESKIYAEKAIKLILNNYINYLNNDKRVYKNILLAANYSGKAINISKTTAAHAMSYKITSLYGISHGHAVAMCLPYIWDYMIKNSNSDLDLIFSELDKLFNTKNHKDTVDKFKKIYNSLNIAKKIELKENDMNILVNSVNIERLKNTPVELDKKNIEKLYRGILSGK